jgi:hypothetical protein
MSDITPIKEELAASSQGARLSVVRSSIPSTPLPTVDEIPQVPDSYKERDDDWKKFDEDLKSWWRKTRRFILEQVRLLTENNNNSDG